MLKLLMCVYICSCILLNSSLTPVTSFHLAAYRSYTSLIMQVKNTESSSKVHKNKYNKFSNKVNDPLLEAIQREQESIRSKTFTFRGTTSQIIPQRKSKQRSASKNSSSSRFVFENVSSVVPSDPFTFGYIQIGVVSGTHGVKGEMKLQVESDFLETYLQANTTVYIKKPTRLTPRAVIVTSSRKQSNSIYLIALESITTRDVAERFKEYSVYIRKDKRPHLDKDEYLVRDLVGMESVVTVNGIARVVGIVAGVVLPSDLCETLTIASKMHSLLEIKTASNRLCLIPFVPEIVTSVNVQTKTIFLSPPDGLLDLTYEEPDKYVIRGYLPEFATISVENRKWLETLHVASESADRIPIARKSTARKNSAKSRSMLKRFKQSSV